MGPKNEKGRPIQTHEQGTNPKEVGFSQGSVPFGNEKLWGKN